MKQILNDVMILKLTLWVATFGIGSNGAESEYEIAHILGHGVGGGEGVGGTPHMKGVGMFVGNFELNP